MRCQLFVSCLITWLDTDISCRVDRGFIYQQNRNVVADWINPMALAAFQAFSVALDAQRLLAHWANQNIQQILRDHEQIVLHWLA